MSENRKVDGVIQSETKRSEKQRADVQGQEKNNVPAQEETVDVFFLCLFVLFRPSVDWIIPAHISEDGPLYSAY